MFVRRGWNQKKEVDDKNVSAVQGQQRLVEDGRSYHMFSVDFTLS